MRLLKEPLFQFLLLGLVIFGWFYWKNPPEDEAASSDRIIVDETDLKWLSEQFRSTRQRPPTRSELTALMNQMVREEVLVREALALGLDQGDNVVRNRLAQKMVFLTTSLAQSMEPASEDRPRGEALRARPRKRARYHGAPARRAAA